MGRDLTTTWVPEEQEGEEGPTGGNNCTLPTLILRTVAGLALVLLLHK